MSVDVSKALFGNVVGPDAGVTVVKVVYGLIMDTGTPEPPAPSGGKRQVMMGSF